jgi:hypothetical protein
MTYREQLTPWCIIRHLPNLQRIVVGRFRRRNDAEDHLRLIRQMCPNVPFSIVFDLPLDSDSVFAQRAASISRSPNNLLKR